MPFDSNRLRAFTSAYDYGCGLHCLAHAYVLNLKQGKFSPAEEERSLDCLLQGFKNHYPGAQSFTRKDLKTILIHDLKNPVHRELVLSRVLRKMLSNPRYHAPGQEVTDEAVMQLANRLGIRVECYGSLRAQALTELRRWNKPATPEAIAQVQAEFMQIFKVKSEAEFEQLDLLAGKNHVPADAPVLKLKNEHGGHWEWEYNILPSAEANRLACEQHNQAYLAHRFDLSKKTAANAYLYGDFLYKRFDEALVNIKGIYHSHQTLSDELSKVEADILAKEARKAKLASAPGGSGSASLPKTVEPSGSSPKVVGTSGSGSSGSSFGFTPGMSPFLSGLGNFFAPIFQALMPAFTANDSQSPMNTAIPVVGNVLTAISNMMISKEHSQVDFAKDEQRTGYNGTKYKGSFFDLFGTVLGWAGSAFNFVGSVLKAQNKPKEDPNVLTEAELNTPEGALLEEYLRFLPDSAASIKKKFIQDFHNIAIPKDTIFKDLRSALIAHGKDVEHDSLLFKQHALKLPKAIQRELKIQYHTTHGSDLVWENLADHLLSHGLSQEAAEILNHPEYQLLNEGFVARRGPATHPDNLNQLKAAQQFYGKALDYCARVPFSPFQFKARTEMMAAIRTGHHQGAKILADLQRIFSEYQGSNPSDEALGKRVGERRLHSVPRILGMDDPDDVPRSSSFDVPGSVSAKGKSPSFSGKPEENLDTLLEEYHRTLSANKRDGASVPPRMSASDAPGFMPAFNAFTRDHGLPRPASATSPRSSASSEASVSADASASPGGPRPSAASMPPMMV